MKKSELRQVIKEEIKSILKEDISIEQAINDPAVQKLGVRKTHTESNGGITHYTIGGRSQSSYSFNVFDDEGTPRRIMYEDPGSRINFDSLKDMVDSINGKDTGTLNPYPSHWSY